jgi:UDP-N-acetylmuramate--alanine ligase
MTQKNSAELVPGLAENVHLLGAGGAGLSGAARLLIARGHTVTGYDRAESPFTANLAELGIELTIADSDASCLPQSAGAVVRSAAIGDDDPQVALALERGLTVLKYSELLGVIAPEERTLAVAGTHGKTTASWMLFHALQGVTEVGERGAPEPGALIGGLHQRFGRNAVAPGPGGWFAVEACEYDRSFLQLRPRGAVITNLEEDHLDYYGTYDELERAFARFVDQIHPDGLLVVGENVSERVTEAAHCPVWRMGRELEVDLLAEHQGFFQFRLRGPGWASSPVQLKVPGAFNVENAALALALSMGVAAQDVDSAEALAASARALHRFIGVERRFEPWGTSGGVEVVHDYAHHPTEVAATLEAARRTMPGKPIHVLFQPHQHSRTARFLAEFVEALRGADRVIVADVYGARVHIDREGAGAADLVQRLVRAGVDAATGGTPSESVHELCAHIGGESAALVLGAGDIDGIKDELLHELALRGSAPGRPLR